MMFVAQLTIYNVLFVSVQQGLKLAKYSVSTLKLKACSEIERRRVSVTHLKLSCSNEAMSLCA